MSLLSKKISFPSLVSRGAARPHTAVEIAPEGALAAALSTAGSAPLHAFSALPPGALAPGIAETNICDPRAVTEALRVTLDLLAPRNRSVTLIIPDIASRVFVLDFDAFPAKQAEAIPVLRFRLRKMIPFDVEHSAVSYQVLAKNGSAGSGQVKVLVSVMPGSILAEYEAAVEAAGYEPGAVLPSSLAALAALDSPEPALAANLGSASLTTFIAGGDDLLLYRTVDLPAENANLVAEVQRSVAVAAAFFEDKLGRRPSQLYYAGAAPAVEFARAVSDEDLRVVEIAPAPSTGAASAIGPIGFAGVLGALAGVA